MNMFAGTLDPDLMVKRTHNFQQNIALNKRLPLRLLPRRNPTLGHGRGHGRHLEVGDGATGSRAMQYCWRNSLIRAV